MIIVAKYNSSCPKCGTFIDAGTKVEWSKGQKATHVTCPSGEAASSKRRDAALVARHTVSHHVPVPNAETAPFVAYEKWEPCKRAALGSAVGEQRRYEGKRGTAYERGAQNGAQKPAHGCFTVVAQDARYESTEDNEDIGDCTGPGWQVTLYLRRATPEEEQKDINGRLGPALVKWALAMIASRAVSAKREAKAALEALAAQPGCVRVELWSWPEALRTAGTCETLWDDGKGSTRRRITLDDGSVILASHDYIYDWDQPFVLAGPESVLAPLALAQALPYAFGCLQRLAKASGSMTAEVRP